MIENRALVSFPSRQEIDKSLKSRKLQIFSIFAILRLLYRVIDMPISIFRFSCLISECHLLGNEDIFTLVMMMKKLRWFQLRNILRIAVTKSNEQLKTIKIVQDWSFSEIQWEVRDPLLCDICSVSMMSQAFLDRHIKWKVVPFSWFLGLQRRECGVVKHTRKQLRDHKRLHMCLSEMWTDGYQIKVSQCLSVFLLLF